MAHYLVPLRRGDGGRCKGLEGERGGVVGEDSIFSTALGKGAKLLMSRKEKEAKSRKGQRRPRGLKTGGVTIDPKGQKEVNPAIGSTTKKLTSDLH